MPSEYEWHHRQLTEEGGNSDHIVSMYLLVKNENYDPKGDARRYVVIPETRMVKVPATVATKKG